jgi:hypothetical protein
MCVRWLRVEAAQSPGGKGQFREAVGERVGEAGEGSGKVISHGDSDAAGVFDDGEDDGDFGSGLLTDDMDPVFPADGPRAYGVFGEVVFPNLSSWYSRKRVSFGQSASVQFEALVSVPAGNTAVWAAVIAGLISSSSARTFFLCRVWRAAWTRFEMRDAGLVASGTRTSPEQKAVTNQNAVNFRNGLGGVPHGNSGQSKKFSISGYSIYSGAVA